MTESQQSLSVVEASNGWGVVFFIALVCYLVYLLVKRQNTSKSNSAHKEHDEHNPSASDSKDHGKNGTHPVTHGPKKESGLEKLRIYSIIGLVLVILCAVIFFFTEKSNREYRTHVTGSTGQVQTANNIANRSGGLTSTTTATSELYVRHAFTAPPETCSEWIPVPPGTQPMVCEANKDLSCASEETDLSKVPYGYRYKDLSGTPHDDLSTYNPEVGSMSAMCVYSKTDKDLELAWWLVPFKKASGS